MSCRVVGASHCMGWEMTQIAVICGCVSDRSSYGCVLYRCVVGRMIGWISRLVVSWRLH